MIPRDTHDGAFYRAVLALHQDLFSLAQQVGDIITHSYSNWSTFAPLQSGQSTLKVYVFSKNIS